jgi:hypothetical protein
VTDRILAFFLPDPSSQTVKNMLVVPVVDARERSHVVEIEPGAACRCLLT